MKLETNFSRTSAGWLVIINNIMLVTSVILILLTIYLFYKGSDIQNKILDLTSDTIKLQSHIDQERLIIRRYLTEEQTLQLKDDVVKINNVSELSGLDLVTLLNAIEHVLPNNIRLEKLKYNARNSVSTLTIQSTDSDSLNSLVEKVQQDFRFDRVELIDQKQLNIKSSVFFEYQLIIHHKLKT